MSKAQKWFDRCYPPPTIDRRKKIHKLLDENMENKWVSCTNEYGSFSGPYITHRHIRSTGITVLVYLCTQKLNADGAFPMNKVTVVGCTDWDLDSHISIESHPGADDQKKACFGTSNTNMIKNILKFNNYKF